MKRILCIGDSMTDRRAGGKTLEMPLDFYPKYLAEQMEVAGNVWSVTFRRIEDVFGPSLSLKCLLEVRPDYCVFQHGGDDLDAGMLPMTLLGYFSLVLQWTMGNVLFLEIPTLHKRDAELAERRELFNHLLRQAFKGRTLSYFPSLWSGGLIDEHDEPHPVATYGDRQMARIIWDSIRAMTGWKAYSP